MMLKRNLSLPQSFLWRQKYANRGGWGWEKEDAHGVGKGLLERGCIISVHEHAALGG